MTDQSDLEKTLKAREVLQHLSDLPPSLKKEMLSSLIEDNERIEKEKKAFEEKERLRLNGPDKNYPKSDNVIDDNKRVTLKPLPDLERDKDWERIIGGKIYTLSDMLKKVGDDITKKGYLTKDPSLRQSIALGTDAMIDYITPLWDDKFLGEWRDLFEPIVKRYLKDSDFFEEPEFIRQYRYELDLESGNIKGLHEFSDKYYLSGSIIERINNVIKISDCIQFFGALFENNRQIRQKEQERRDENKRT